MSLHRLSHQNIPSVSSSFSVVSPSVSFLSLSPLPLFILLPDYVWTSPSSYWQFPSCSPLTPWEPAWKISLLLLLLLVRRQVNLLLSCLLVSTFPSENAFSFLLSCFLSFCLSFLTKNINSHHVWTVEQQVARFALITWKITRLLHKQNNFSPSKSPLSHYILTPRLIFLNHKLHTFVSELYCESQPDVFLTSPPLFFS